MVLLARFVTENSHLIEVSVIRTATTELRIKSIRVTMIDPEKNIYYSATVKPTEETWTENEFPLVGTMWPSLAEIFPNRASFLTKVKKTLDGYKLGSSL